MISLTGKWVGDTKGTHRDNIFLEFENYKQKITCDLRLANPYSLTVRKFIGKCHQQNEDGLISINLIEDSDLKDNVGNIYLRALSESQLNGEYELKSGEKGIFEIRKIYCVSFVNNDEKPSPLFHKTEPILYPLKIFRKNIHEILEKLKQLVTKAGNIQVIERFDNLSIPQSADIYLKNKGHFPGIKELIITAATPPNGLYNITLHLKQKENSFIVVNSLDEAWADLAINSIKPYLEAQRSVSLQFFKKYGNDLKIILFLILITYIPDLTLRERGAYITGFIIFSLLYQKSYKYITQTIIQQNNDSPKKFKEKFPVLNLLIDVVKIFLMALIPIVLEKLSHLHTITLIQNFF